MRTFALHSADGTISGLVTSPDDAPVPVLTPPPGFAFTEVVLSDDASLSDPLDADAFRSFVSSYRVAPSERRLLVAREK